MKRLTTIATIIVSSIALAHSAPASADEYSESEDAGRRGILIGFGLQGGHIRFECDNDPDCGGQLNEAGGVDLHIAYMLSRKLALSADAWAMAHQEDVPLLGQVTVTHSIVTIGPQFWLVPRIWVRAGLGWARLSLDYGQFQDQTESVLGVMAGLGWEVLTSRSFALDIQGRVGTGFYDGGDAINAGLGVGFTWF